MGLGCGTPTNFMPADVAQTAQRVTITPAFMGWGQKRMITKAGKELTLKLEQRKC